MGCPFRKGAINCYASFNCSTCGWNPEVEEERKAKLRSGEVKSYLVFDSRMQTLLNMKERGGPYNEDED